MRELTKEQMIIAHLGDEGVRQRVFAYIAAPAELDGCMIWKGGLNGKGYGQKTFKLGDREICVRAHRLVYAYFTQSCPAHLQLDHLCRVRACVRPDHLEPVTGKENTARSPITPQALAKAKTRCVRGHSLAGDNLYVHVRVSGTDQRSCRACNALRRRAARARKRDHSDA